MLQVTKSHLYHLLVVSDVVDRARVNSTTRYSPEAPAEGLYQVGLFTSALSHLYHGYFLKRTPPDPYLDNYYDNHIDFEIVMSHFRVHSVMMIIFSC